MKKRTLKALLCLLLISGLLSGSIPVCAAGESADNPPVQPLKVIRRLAALQAVGGVDPWSEYWAEWNKDVRADLSSHPGLAFSLTFGTDTSFSEALPAGYDPEKLLEWGKYPGLNIDLLHQHGYTGKGTVIAYIDQPIPEHEQYTRDSVHYINNTNAESSMHGPAVLSLLTGRDIGTAPEAEVYFYGHAAWEADQTTHSECLYQIIEQNKSLPEDRKIRMVAFSDNIDETEKNTDAFRTAVAACEASGVMVWFCGDYAPLSFIPFADKNTFESLAPTTWGDNAPPLVYVPSSGRTTAAGDGGYIYWSNGGLSWTMPYVFGLYAIALQVDPSLTREALCSLIQDTAYVDELGRRIVNPVPFIAAVLQGAGREDEARDLLDDLKARTRYLYAVMDTAALSEADLSAIGKYLASVTDATVLVVDAARFSDAQEVYAAMRQDAEQRGGAVAGVQIFGTPAMIPAFSIGYKVQMVNGVDDAGTLLTDLFYGTFANDPELLSPDYNVMDHLASGREVRLVPEWPVVRLPLSRDGFSDFFRKYDSFILDTGLQRLPLVNFSNPIFKQKDHSDDMGLFLSERMDRELISYTYMHTNTTLILKRSRRYFDQVGPILRKYGIPDDLKYLMAIESNLDPKALSTAGAAGLWQFTKSTATQYGLEVSGEVDERYHIEKETVAACKFLKDALAKFGNWMTVAASYNAGQAGIRKRLDDQRQTTALELWLPEETSRYMFRLLAMKMFFEHPAAFGFDVPMDERYPYVAPRKTVTVSGPIESLVDFAESNGTTYARLKGANLWLRSDKLTNKNKKTYEILIP